MLQGDIQTVDKPAPVPDPAPAPPKEIKDEKAAPAPAKDQKDEKAAPVPARDQKDEKAAPAPARDQKDEKAAPAPVSPPPLPPFIKFSDLSDQKGFDKDAAKAKRILFTHDVQKVEYQGKTWFLKKAQSAKEKPADAKHDDKGFMNALQEILTQEVHRFFDPTQPEYRLVCDDDGYWYILSEEVKGINLSEALYRERHPELRPSGEAAPKTCKEMIRDGELTGFGTKTALIYYTRDNDPHTGNFINADSEEKKPDSDEAKVSRGLKLTKIDGGQGLNPGRHFGDRINGPSARDIKNAPFPIDFSPHNLFDYISGLKKSASYETQLMGKWMITDKRIRKELNEAWLQILLWSDQVINAFVDRLLGDALGKHPVGKKFKDRLIRYRRELEDALFQVSSFREYLASDEASLAVQAFKNNFVAYKPRGEDTNLLHENVAEVCGTADTRFAELREKLKDESIIVIDPKAKSEEVQDEKEAKADPEPADQPKPPAEEKEDVEVNIDPLDQENIPPSEVENPAPPEVKEPKCDPCKYPKTTGGLIFGSLMVVVALILNYKTNALESYDSDESLDALIKCAFSFVCGGFFGALVGAACFSKNNKGQEQKDAPPRDGERRYRRPPTPMPDDGVGFGFAFGRGSPVLAKKPQVPKVGRNLGKLEEGVPLEDLEAAQPHAGPKPFPPA